MGEIVVDTSVLAALVYGESKSVEARMLLNDNRLFAPMLMGYELAQLTVKKVKRYPEDRDKILEAFSFALSLDIHWMEIHFAAVVKLALKCRLTAYDASFLYLSRSLNIPLATFDSVLKCHCL